MDDDRFEKAARMVLGDELPSFEFTDNHIRLIAGLVEQRMGTPILPRPGESLAISLSKPKTAALAFDRVYRLPVMADPLPESIGYYCATFEEIAAQASIYVVGVAKQLGLPSSLDVPASSLTEEQRAREEKTSLKAIVASQARDFGLTPTIIFEDAASRARELPPGSRAVLTAALSNLDIVDEARLEWEQVEEFRRDEQAKAKYRRLARWIDGELAEKSPAQVEDDLAIRLDDYEWSIRKHGLKAAIGSISSIVDPKFISGVSAAIGGSALAGAGLWGVLAGGVITLGKVTAEFGKLAIEGAEERRAANYEIAYVHDVKKALGTS